MRAVVVGATGNLGTSLLEALAGEEAVEEIVAVARRIPQRQFPRTTFVAADITRLPYADATFDAVICGWVLEHLPDPRPGLKELARVVQPGGKVLLLTTEDTLLGSVCSRLWHCRTYNRAALRKVCEESGLCWRRELWFTRLHAFARLGGIVVELSRQQAPVSLESVRIRGQDAFPNPLSAS